MKSAGMGLCSAVTLAFCLSGCIHRSVAPPVVVQGGPDYLIINLAALDDDYVCVETAMFIQREKANRFCMTVREFRIILSSKSAGP